MEGHISSNRNEKEGKLRGLNANEGEGKLGMSAETLFSWYSLSAWARIVDMMHYLSLILVIVLFTITLTKNTRCPSSLYPDLAQFMQFGILILSVINKLIWVFIGVLWCRLRCGLCAGCGWACDFSYSITKIATNCQELRSKMQYFALK